MKALVCIAAGIALFISGQLVAKETKVPIVSNGVTEINSVLGGMRVTIRILTREIAINKLGHAIKSESSSRCTLSKYPCSVVVSFNIRVGGNDLFIPRSLFCDLSDINNIEIMMYKNEAKLKVLGGDASESYVVNIIFDSNEVKSRSFASAMAPGEHLQDTVYHAVVVGD